MSRYLAAVVVLLCSLAAFASEPSLRWRGYQFLEVSSVSALPPSIRKQLATDLAGLNGVADKGARFNATDFIQDSWPMRRLLGAGKSGDTWLVALEQGGRGYNVQVYLFSDGVQQQHWVLTNFPSTLQAVIDQLPSDPADER